MRWRDRYFRELEWHRHFAWSPTLLTGTETTVWLEFIERRWHNANKNPLGGTWQYRSVVEYQEGDWMKGMFR